MTMWRLIDSKTRKELKQGDKVKTFRGWPAVFVSGTPPHKPCSMGRVLVREKGCDGETEYFPGVIGAEWIKE